LAARPRPLRQIQRLVAKAPFGKWRTSVSAALLRRPHRFYVIDGPINGASFRAYIEQVLAPILAPDDIVVRTTLGSHKGRAIRAAIRAAKAKLFLPAYSPDLDVIEQAFAKWGNHLQGRRPDNRTDLANHRPCSTASADRMRLTTSKTPICFTEGRSRAAPR
jgi:transposase